MFDSARNQELVPEIEKLNREFLARGENYILIGPVAGIVGSALGIP